MGNQGTVTTMMWKDKACPNGFISQTAFSATISVIEV
jgi:hypothetical protein